jgi:hypothetical protein
LLMLFGCFYLLWFIGGEEIKIIISKKWFIYLKLK